MRERETFIYLYQGSPIQTPWALLSIGGPDKNETNQNYTILRMTSTGKRLEKVNLRYGLYILYSYSESE